LGEAGHGKTTVLLHRLSQLWRSANPLLDRHSIRAAVVVPTEGLARLLQPLIRRMGVDIEVLTYDRWAASQARRAFRGLPRESELTPPAVMRLKRDAALRVALGELAQREPGRIDDEVDAVARRTRAHVTRGDLQHLFGDRLLLERVASLASIPARAVDEVLERTRVQTGLTAEQEWAHVSDRRRLIALDGRPLDEGTATSHADTIDVEDYAVLFELDRLRAAGRGLPASRPRGYDLLAIDEAQDLAPLELALLGRSLAPGGSLVVAGDADQQTDATTTFAGWEAAMHELGQGDYTTVRLGVGYRCPPAVVALARFVRDAAGRPPEPAGSPGSALLRFEDELSLASRLAGEMRDLLRNDPRASVLVVCRSPMTARRLVVPLRAEVPTRLVFDGRFLARGPVQVTTVDEIKGLEFDFVVVPDAGARDYPDDAASRRAMYVALTRARHQVVLACVGASSPILAA
jgi:hypothetical protein